MPNENSSPQRRVPGFAVNEGASTSATARLEASRGRTVLSNLGWRKISNNNLEDSDLSASAICVFCKTNQEYVRPINQVKQAFDFYTKELNETYVLTEDNTKYVCFKCAFVIHTSLSFRNKVLQNNGHFMRRLSYSAGDSNNKTIKLYRPKSVVQNPIVPKIKVVNIEKLMNNYQEVNNNMESSLESNNYDNNETSLLTIMSETAPQSVIETESGQQSTYRSRSSRNSVFTCNICNEQFTNMRLLRKHSRDKHRRPRSVVVKSKSLENLPTTSSNSNVETYNENNKENNTQKPERNRIIKCPACPGEFFNPLDGQIHLAQCIGVLYANNNVKGYRTRSRTRAALSRLQSRNNSVCESDADSVIINELEFSQEMRDVQNWLANQSSTSVNDDAVSAAAVSGDECDSRSVITDISSVSKRSRGRPKKINKVVKEKSVRGRGRPKKLRELALPPHRTTGVEYVTKCNPLEHGYAQIIFQPKLIEMDEPTIFNCPVKDCGVKDKDLQKLSDHHMSEHCDTILPSYYCKTCDSYFSHYFFYEQHCWYNQYGWFFCIKCERKFDYKSQLHKHLEEHKKVGKEFKCDTCKLSFISEIELQDHCYYPKHCKIAARKAIIFERIDYDDVKNVMPKHIRNQNISLIDNEVYGQTLNITNIPGKRVNPFKEDVTKQMEKLRKVGKISEYTRYGLHNCAHQNTMFERRIRW